MAGTANAIITPQPPKSACVGVTTASTTFTTSPTNTALPGPRAKSAAASGAGSGLRWGRVSPPMMTAKDSNSPKCCRTARVGRSGLLVQIAKR